MQTLTIELTHEKAIDFLRDLEAIKVIRFIDDTVREPRGVKLGSLAGQFSIPDDFNAPLSDLKEYE